MWNFLGHSRTIIGVDEGRQGKLRLLILDPSHKSDQMRQLTNTSDSTKSNATTKKIWIPMTSLRARQYQIVCVNGGFVDDDREYLVSYLCFMNFIMYTILYLLFQFYSKVN
jgi:Peptidase family C78